MENKYTPLSRDEIIEKYNLSEDELVYLLPCIEKIENEVFKYVTYHL